MKGRVVAFLLALLSDVCKAALAAIIIAAILMGVFTIWNPSVVTDNFENRVGGNDKGTELQKLEKQLFDHLKKTGEMK